MSKEVFKKTYCWISWEVGEYYIRIFYIERLRRKCALEASSLDP